jgi:hypothetical protein
VGVCWRGGPERGRGGCVRDDVDQSGRQGSGVRRGASDVGRPARLGERSAPPTAPLLIRAAAGWLPHATVPRTEQPTKCLQLPVSPPPGLHSPPSTHRMPPCLRHNVLPRPLRPKLPRHRLQHLGGGLADAEHRVLRGGKGRNRGGRERDAGRKTAGRRAWKANRLGATPGRLCGRGRRTRPAHGMVRGRPLGWGVGWGFAVAAAQLGSCAARHTPAATACTGGPTSAGTTRRRAARERGEGHYSAGGVHACTSEWVCSGHARFHERTAGLGREVPQPETAAAARGRWRPCRPLPHPRGAAAAATHLRGQHGRVLDDGLPHAPVLVSRQVLHSRQQRLGQQLDADDLGRGGGTRGWRRGREPCCPSYASGWCVCM